MLNAKDYGIPQNRERVFIISIRKDIDKGFEFPESFPLKLRLKDMLDDEVDEKFYLDSTKEYFIKHSFEADGISPTMDTCSGGNRMPKILTGGTVIDDTQGFDGTRYYDNVSPSLRASRSGLKVVTKTVTNSGCDDEVVTDE